ncbi:expressed unknown protein [Seminavis robusta]|uniref:Uncharacterized protein n=1 Tax=Seminavis robusta TaxID=568900 RepID=A0A9N8EQA0_9STRA|nr:expressed unknown protein [Seminavis robusta]|eukprot:Sro1334_g263810.1 n/a (491) ;mRNA; r:15132-16604
MPNDGANLKNETDYSHEKDLKCEGSNIFIPAVPDPLASERVLAAVSSDDDDQYPVTCQVKIDTSPNSPPNHAAKSGWILTSIDCHGKEKSVGGDEFYIAYTAPISSKDDDTTTEERRPYTAVALVEDCKDGTYWLDFCATPTSPRTPTAEYGGHLTIWFQYSCGLGSMAPPTKQAWVNGAYTHRKYQVDLIQNHHKRPTIRPFYHPNLTCCRLPLQQPAIDLSQFDLIVAFGDSTMEQLLRQRPNKKGKYFFQHNLSYGEKVSFGLNTQTVSAFLELLEKGSGSHLSNQKAYRRRAVMIGSAMWDILDSKDTLQGTDYKDHQQACRNYVRAIRQRYPDVTILWKSPTAVHIHAVDLDRLVVSKIGEAALFGIERIRYMSASRSSYLYNVQKALILEEQQHDDKLLFLDLYEATYLSADWLFPSDGRHYRPDLNRLMLQWFYPSTSSVPDASSRSNETVDVESVVVKGDGKGGMLVDMPKPYYIDPTMKDL